jgi:hypothetical protein
VSSRYDRRVILILKCCRAEINEPNFSVKEDFPLGGLSVNCCRRRRYPPTICEGLIGIIAEKDVFRFQIGVDEIKIV